jgi:hypothetical protein
MEVYDIVGEKKFFQAVEWDFYPIVTADGATLTFTLGGKKYVVKIPIEELKKYFKKLKGMV